MTKTSPIKEATADALKTLEASRPSISYAALLVSFMRAGMCAVTVPLDENEFRCRLADLLREIVGGAGIGPFTTQQDIKLIASLVQAEVALDKARSRSKE